MINFLTSLATCEMPGILRIIYFIKVIVELICFVVPMGLIIMMSIDFLKNVMASKEEDMNKNTKLSIKRVIFCCFIFLLPTIIKFSINMVYEATGDEKNFLECYNNADLITIEKFQKIYDAELKAEEGEKTDPDKVTQEEEYVQPGVGSNNLPSYDSTVFIGDSRTVQLGASVGIKSCSGVSKDETFECIIALGSMGIAWFENTATPTLEAILNSYPEVNVMIQMGANDAAFDAFYDDNRAERYAILYNDLVKKYPNTNIIIVSVMQVDDNIMISKGLDLRDRHIVSFNETLKSNLNSGISYCDLYSKMEGKYSTNDGIHYTWDSYKVIYDELKSCL